MNVELVRKPRVVIVGAGYAGMTAAHRLGEKAEVTIVSPEARFVDRIRLHEFAAGGCSEGEVAPEICGLLPKGASHVQGRAKAVEPGRVHLHDGTELVVDHVIVAAGSGVGSGVTSLESSRRLRSDLALLPAGAAVRINGAGHTGVELAAELAERRPDLHILLVDPAGLLPRVSERAQREARGHLERAGVIFTSQIQDGYKAEIDVDCTGFATPHIAGLSAPDTTLSFGPGLWVAGDIADTGLRWSCAAAEPMGAHAADNILLVHAGLPPQPFRFGYAIQCISLGRRRGIVQPVRRDDSPRRLVITGVTGAFIKERISRMARRVATGSAGSYRWPSGPAIAGDQGQDVSVA